VVGYGWYNSRVSESRRILLVAARYPWPPTDGYRSRVANMALALAEVGQVDVVALSGPGSPEPVDPPSERITPFIVEESPPPPMLARLQKFLVDGRPSRVGLDKFVDARPLITTLVADHRYDLVWLSLLDTWEGVADLVPAPVICDLDNLENFNARSRRALRPVWPEGGVVARGRVAARWVFGQVLDRINEPRWARRQRLAADGCEHVVVCSPLDVVRSGCPNALCVPNGYERSVDPPVRRRDLGGSPVLAFVGLMSYGPNTDGARWFAREVLPLVQRQIPDVTLRIIGRGTESVSDLAGVRGVDVVGAVDDMEVALRDVDIEVIPLRFGAGTRLKAVEAFANRLPVVSTAIGVEGLDVSHRREVLIAEDPAALAAAVVELCGDPGTRQRLADNAEQLYESHYRWSAIREAVAEVVRGVVDGPDR
jgi:glycosyltransferase involved in cell wall biosynthesis